MGSGAEAAPQLLMQPHPLSSACSSPAWDGDCVLRRPAAAHRDTERRGRVCDGAPPRLDRVVVGLLGILRHLAPVERPELGLQGDGLRG